MRCSARRGEARQLQVLLGGSAAMLVMLAVSSYQSYGGSSGAAALPQASRRELGSLEELRQERELQGINITSVEVKVETKCSGDFGKLQRWELRGGLLLHLVATLYVFLGIAIVCDDFFVEALERISAALKLSDDVAGATFMAAGSSAPELAVAVVSTLLASEPGDEGLGTIVGSAVFNIMVIVGVTAIFAGQVLDITPYPFARDCLFYTLSIAMLVAFVYDGKVEPRVRARLRAQPNPEPKPKPSLSLTPSLTLSLRRQGGGVGVSDPAAPNPNPNPNPNQVEVWESVILLLGYALYIVFMTQNEKVA